MHKRNAFAAWHRTGPYTLLIPVERKNGDVLNNTLVLKGSGPLLWDLLEVPRSLEDLVQALLDEYEVAPEVARADVLRFIEMLVNWKALDEIRE